MQVDEDAPENQDVTPQLEARASSAASSERH